MIYVKLRNPIKPSIAQLEERGTVICNLSSVLSRGRWFEPGSKDVLFLLISLYFPTNKQQHDSSRYKATTRLTPAFCTSAPITTQFLRLSKAHPATPTAGIVKHRLSDLHNAGFYFGCLPYSFCDVLG